MTGSGRAGGVGGARSNFVSIFLAASLVDYVNVMGVVLRPSHFESGLSVGKPSR